MNHLKSLALAAVAVVALVALPAIADAQSRGGGHSGGGAGHSRPAGAPVHGAAVPVHGGGPGGGHGPGGPVYGSPNHGHYYPAYGRPYYPYYPYYGYPYYGYGYPCCYGPGFSFSIGFGYGPYAYAPYGYGAYGYGAGYGPYAYSGYYGRPYGGVRLDMPQRDAEVFADGYYLGTVNDFDGFTQQANLEPGPHRIEVRQQGFEPMSFDVNIAAGQTVRYRASLRQSQP